MTHSELVALAHKWVVNNASCGFAFKELKTLNSGNEIPDVIGFGSWGHSVLIECKVSRSDFLGDHKKYHRQPGKGMGKRRYYCCPVNIIKPEELPEGWGLIYERNGKLKVMVHPQREIVYEYGTRKEWIEHDKNIDSEWQMMYSALRRLSLRGRLDEIYEPFNVRDNEKLHINSSTSEIHSEN
jgi:hypothetical protein